MENHKKDVHMVKSIVTNLLEGMLIFAILLIACLIGGSDVVIVIYYVVIRSILVFAYIAFIKKEFYFKKMSSNVLKELTLLIPYAVVQIIYPDLNLLIKIMTFVLSISSDIFCFLKDKSSKNLLDLLLTILIFTSGNLVGYNLFKKIVVPVGSEISMDATKGEKNTTDKYIMHFKNGLKPALSSLKHGAILVIPLLDYRNVLNRNLESGISTLNIVLILNVGVLFFFIYGFYKLLKFARFITTLLSMIKDDFTEIKNGMVKMQRIPHVKDECKVIMNNFSKVKEIEIHRLKLKQTLSHFTYVSMVVIPLTCIVVNIWFKRLCIATYKYAVRASLKLAEVCIKYFRYAAVYLILLIRYACVLKDELQPKIEFIRNVLNFKVKPVIKSLAEIISAIGLITFEIYLISEKSSIDDVCYQIALAISIPLSVVMFNKIRGIKCNFDLDFIKELLIKIAAIVSTNSFVVYCPSLGSFNAAIKVLIFLVVFVDTLVFALRRDKKETILDKLMHIKLASLSGPFFDKIKDYLLCLSIGFPMLSFAILYQVALSNNLEKLGTTDPFLIAILTALITIACILSGICGFFITFCIPLIDCISRNKNN